MREGGEGKKVRTRQNGQTRRVGLVQTDWRGRLLDTTMIDLMWAKQAP
jgi:hypothetical protein